MKKRLQFHPRIHPELYLWPPDDGVLRMVSSSDPLARGSVWPNRFEAKAAGIYRVKVDLSYYKPIQGHIPEVHLLSRQSDGSNFARASQLKKLAEFKVPDQKPSSFVAEVELQRGETLSSTMRILL